MAHATTRVATVLSTSLRHNAAALAAAARRARRGEARGIHRLRVASRRLREALPAGAELAAMDGAGPEALIRDLRRLTKSLGPVRELDVARTVLAGFAEREAWPAAVVGRVDAYCTRLRDEAFAGAVETIDRFDVKETRRILQAIAASLGGGRGSSSLGTRLRDRAGALTREIEGAGTLYAPAALHRVRIAAKKLRYVVELTGEQVPGSLRRLRALQSGLGRLHDAQVLQHRIQELAASSGDRALVATLTAMDRTIEAACREWHAGALKTLPGISALAAGLAREVPAGIQPRRVGRPVKMHSADHGRRRKRIA